MSVSTYMSHYQIDGGDQEAAWTEEQQQELIDQAMNESSDEVLGGDSLAVQIARLIKTFGVHAVLAEINWRQR